MLRRFNLLVALTIAAAAPPVVADTPLARYEFTQVQMGVLFKLVFYAESETAANGAAQVAFSRVEQLNNVLSDYDSQSELSRLSRTGPASAAVRVSDDLWHVLEHSQNLSERSNGAFDVTVGPLTKLWRRARRNGQLPAPDQLAAARKAVGNRFVRLNPQDRSVQLLAPEMRLDLGGIGIGYAVDEALAVLRNHGIRRAMLDASGDIGLGDPPPGETGWKIGIAPLQPEAPPSRYLTVANCAVTTAGDAFQYVEIDGVRYSHILDPRTGLGLTNRSAVTVIAPTCTAADSLDTAVSVLGPQRGLALIEATCGAAVLIMHEVNGKVETIESRRFPKSFSRDPPEERGGRAALSGQG
jgi:thiamine biosynthesis lipoprotein